MCVCAPINTRTARPRTINNQQGSGHTKQGFRVATGAPSFEGWILGPRARATRSQTTCEGCALRDELICAKVWPSRERERAVSRARARRGATTARLRVGHAGAAPRSCEGVSRTPSSRGATPVPTEGTLKSARACGGRALYVVSRGARIASGTRRCAALRAGAVA